MIPGLTMLLWYSRDDPRTECVYVIIGYCDTRFMGSPGIIHVRSIWVYHFAPGTTRVTWESRVGTRHNMAQLDIHVRVQWWLHWLVLAYFDSATFKLYPSFTHLTNIGLH